MSPQVIETHHADTHAVDAGGDSPFSLDIQYDDDEFPNIEGLRNLFLAFKWYCFLIHVLLFPKGASNDMNNGLIVFDAASAGSDTTDSLFSLGVLFDQDENTESEGCASASSESTKSTYQKHDYNFVKIVSDKKDVDEWMKNSGCFVFLSESKTKNSTIDYYRCNQVSRSAYKDCPVRAKVERRHDDNLYRIYRTNSEHHHPDTKSQKMSVNFKEMILEMHKNGTRPVHIHSRMKEKFPDTFHYNIEQVRYVVRKNQEKNVDPAVSIGDLIAWARANKTVPTDIDTPFVIATSHLNNKFNIVFSALRSLSHADRNVLSADTTYQTHWQEYPLNIVGVFDKMNQFHILALSLSSSETSNDYAFLFDAVKNEAKKHHNIDVNPNYIMADAAFQMSNAFESIFPYVVDNDFNTLMCMFHVLKAINAFKFQHSGSKEKIKIDIKVLQMCGNPTVFSNHMRSVYF